MKKSYPCTKHSDKTCEGRNCDRKLKRRRVEEHKDTLCYSCQQRKRQLAGKSHRIFKRKEVVE